MRRLVRQFPANPKRFFFLFWILFAPALLVLGAPPALSQPYSFETATLGTTGVTTGGLVIGGDGEMQLVGAKFEILHPTKITHMGGHVAGSQLTPSDIFVAVFPLWRMLYAMPATHWFRNSPMHYPARGFSQSAATAVKTIAPALALGFGAPRPHLTIPVLGNTT